MATIEQYWWDGTWRQENAVTVPVAVATPVGLYFDGVYFWILDDNGARPYLFQLYVNDAGVASIVSISYVYANLGLDVSETLLGVSGITGDGVDLYIGVNINRSLGGFPPVSTVESHIYKLDKNAFCLRPKIATISGLAEGPYNDLTWNGLGIYASRDTAQDIVFVELESQRISWVSARFGRPVVALAFNGNSIFYCANNNRAGQFSVDNASLTPTFLLGATIKAFDFATGELEKNGFCDFINGEKLYVLRG